MTGMLAALQDQPLPEAEAELLVRDLESRARRYETPCGKGTMVWRAWGSGPPVLLAHGAQGAWSHWIRNIDALASERTVWAVDLPGFGESAMPPESDHASISAVIASGVRALLPESLPIDMVGFSFGGVALAYLSASFPDIVRSLILVDTGGLGTPLGTISLQRVRGLEGEARRAAHRANLLGLMLHHPASADDLAVHLQEVNGFRSRLDVVGLVLPDKLRAVLPDITVPLGCIWADHDLPHPNPAAQEDVLRAFRPNLDFRVIADAGHWVMYERPEAFNRTLIDMLRGPTRRSKPPC